MSRKLTKSEKIVLDYIKTYKIGQYIYMQAVKRNLKVDNPQKILKLLIQKDFIEVKKAYIYHCPICNTRSHIKLEKEINSLDEVYCENCDEDITTKNKFIGYKLIKKDLKK